MSDAGRNVNPPDRPSNPGQVARGQKLFNYPKNYGLMHSIHRREVASLNISFPLTMGGLYRMAPHDSPRPVLHPSGPGSGAFDVAGAELGRLLATTQESGSPECSVLIVVSGALQHTAKTQS